MMGSGLLSIFRQGGCKCGQGFVESATGGRRDTDWRQFPQRRPRWRPGEARPIQLCQFRSSMKRHPANQHEFLRVWEAPGIGFSAVLAWDGRLFVSRNGKWRRQRCSRLKRFGQSLATSFQSHIIRHGGKSAAIPQRATGILAARARRNAPRPRVSKRRAGRLERTFGGRRLIMGIRRIQKIGLAVGNY
jgi:hypothetical protein